MIDLNQFTHSNIASRLSSEVSEPSHHIYKLGWEVALKDIDSGFQPEFFAEIAEHFYVVERKPQLQDLKGLSLLSAGNTQSFIPLTLWGNQHCSIATAGSIRGTCRISLFLV
jgi:hypothetical protein